MYVKGIRKAVMKNNVFDSCVFHVEDQLQEVYLRHLYFLRIGFNAESKRHSGHEGVQPNTRN